MVEAPSLLLDVLDKSLAVELVLLVLAPVPPLVLAGLASLFAVGSAVMAGVVANGDVSATWGPWQAGMMQSISERAWVGVCMSRTLSQIPAARNRA